MPTWFPSLEEQFHSPHFMLRPIGMGSCRQGFLESQELYRVRNVFMALQHLQSPAQNLGCPSPLSFGESTALLLHKSDYTILGSEIWACTTPTKSSVCLGSAELGLVIKQKKKHAQSEVGESRGRFQAILPLEVKIPRNRLLKLTRLTPCKYYVSKVQVWNIQLYAVSIFSYMHIYKIFYILEQPNPTMVHSHRVVITVINKKTPNMVKSKGHLHNCQGKQWWNDLQTQEI